MTFKQAVEAAPHPVNGKYRRGKQALENTHRNLVQCDDSRRLTGSIDLDSALKQHRPNDPRWDYGVDYQPARGRERAIWVEVHSAKTSEVSTVLNKLQWLKDWLNEEAEDLRRLTDRAGKEIPYVWIASAGDNINRNSRQFRLLSQRGVRLQNRLALP